MEEGVSGRDVKSRKFCSQGHPGGPTRANKAQTREEQEGQPGPTPRKVKQIGAKGRNWVNFRGGARIFVLGRIR